MNAYLETWQQELSLSLLSQILLRLVKIQAYHMVYRVSTLQDNFFLCHKEAHNVRLDHGEWTLRKERCVYKFFRFGTFQRPSSLVRIIPNGYKQNLNLWCNLEDCKLIIVEHTDESFCSFESFYNNNKKQISRSSPSEINNFRKRKS